MKAEEMTRDAKLGRMAEAYYELLTTLAPALRSNRDIEAGINEGLGKFLSNVCISIDGKKSTDYYSEVAYRQLTAGDCSGLVYEHMIPKKIYQEKIVDSFVNGKGMTAEEIKAELDKYWWIATITKEEDARLRRLTMPHDWDGKDVLARYREAGIQLKARETPAKTGE